MLQLRPATPDDLPWLIRQHGALYRAEFGFAPDFEASIAAKVAAFTDAATAFTRLWIATVEGKRAGSLAISRQAEGVAFLNFILVLPRYRGRGVARALLDQAITHARDHGYQELRLETYSCLGSARNLYRQYGFTIASVNPDQTKFGQRFDQEFWQRPL